MSLLLNYVVSASGAAPGPVTARRGVVRFSGQVTTDDDGVFHPLGLTLFWSLYGWKFERQRILDHLAWISQFGFDYLRVLGEVDWEGRSIEPGWSDYAQNLQEFVDTAYDVYGLRIEMTIVGGRQYDENDGHQRFVPADLARQVSDALKGREHKVLHYEMANEWDRLDKVMIPDMQAMAQVVVGATPNLVALSRPADSSSKSAAMLHASRGIDEPDDELLDLAVQALMNLTARRQSDFDSSVVVLGAALAPGGKFKDLLGKEPRKGTTLEALLQLVREHFGPDVDTRESVDSGGRAEMIEATQAVGANTYTPHTRRSDHDYKWSHVRQGYDFKDYPSPTSNNEPQGPQSSVETLDNPLQLAMARLLGILCGGSAYVLHVGQGVTGKADPKHGRPENMWEVPNIDEIMRVVRQVDALVPDGIENWTVVNNGRSNHPLPLDDHAGFWEGSDDNAPAVNKNYCALSGGADFVVILAGCKSVEETGPVPATIGARRACHVEAWDPYTMTMVAEADLAVGQRWDVPGRADTMAGYWVRGRFL